MLPSFCEARLPSFRGQLNPALNLRLFSRGAFGSSRGKNHAPDSVDIAFGFRQR